MKTILENIQEKDYTSAQDQLHERLREISVEKLHEIKKMIAAKMTEQTRLNPMVLPSVDKLRRGLTEDNPEEVEKKEKGQ